MTYVADSPIPAPTAESWDFAEGHAPVTEGLHQARLEAVGAGLTPVSPGVASTLTVLAKAVNARTVVEIGTALGTSALPLMAGMTSDGVLTSIDSEADNQLPARTFLNAAGYPPSRCRLIAGAPLEILPKLRDGAYDIVLVNVDKLSYVEYIDQAQRLLRSGGLLLVNDALLGNLVADTTDDSDEPMIIREALESVAGAEDFTALLLPLGEGLLAAIKH